MKIRSIENLTDTFDRYDLEIEETHNFVAEGVVVHNSNFRAIYKDGQLWVGSHRQFKKKNKPNIFWLAASMLNLEEKLSKYEGMALYGEVYGHQKKFPYDTVPGNLEKMIGIRIFDVFDTNKGRYLDWPEYITFMMNVGLSGVGAPVIYIGPWKPSCDVMRFGKSMIGDHVREGFVVKPELERYERNCGRVVFKMVSEDYWVATGKND